MQIYTFPGYAFKKKVYLDFACSELIGTPFCDPCEKFRDALE